MTLIVYHKTIKTCVEILKQSEESGSYFHALESGHQSQF